MFSKNSKLKPNSKEMLLSSFINSSAFLNVAKVNSNDQIYLNRSLHKDWETQQK